MITRLKVLGTAAVGAATIGGTIIAGLPLLEGKGAPGFLGIYVGNVTEQIAKVTKLRSKNGVFVAYVIPQTPAEQIGLMPADVIVAMNGEPVLSDTDYISALGQLRANEEIALTVDRRGGLMVLHGALAGIPSEETKKKLQEKLFPPRTALTTQLPKPETFVMARTYLPSFYPGAILAEFGNSTSTCLLSYLIPPSSAPIPLDGNAAAIHAYNQTIGLHIASADQAAEYLRFFNGHTWGEYGPFRILEQASFVWPVDLPKAMTLHPLAGKGGPDTYSFETILLYGDDVFTSTLEVNSSGKVKMTADAPLFTNVGQHMLFEKGARCADTPKNVPQNSWPVGPAMDGQWTNTGWDDMLALRHLILATAMED